MGTGAVSVEGSAIKGMLITRESILGRHLVVVLTYCPFCGARPKRPK